MKKYLAFYENEWPANIAELTAVENKPFVGYLKGLGVLFTVIPKPVTGPADNEIWYTTDGGFIITPFSYDGLGANIISNTYEDGKGVIKFDGSVTSIGRGAFKDYYSLTSIVIPDSVVSIGDYAFSYCISLTNITFNGTIDQWNSITKGEDWNYEVPATHVQCSDGQVAL